ncbi:MAG: hypothetical protein ACP5NS_01135 [Candidatus Pacearchaeota archaeon]
MNKKTIVSLIVAVLALFVVPAVSAFASIQYVESDSIVITNNVAWGVEAGQTLDLRVVFVVGATDVNDVRVTARVLGEPGLYDATERFDALSGRVYSKFLSLTLPNDIDELDESFILEVTVESQSSTGDTQSTLLIVQRSSYALDFLSVDSNSQAQAGTVLPIEVVLKNRGRYDAEDTFVEARIPALGISKKIFLEDLGAVDQSDNDLEDDSLEGTILLSIPQSAAPGLYTIELKAYSEDAETTVTRRVEVVGGSANSALVASGSRKTFAANTDGMYTLTIVNSGNNILVYNLVTEADDGLTVDVEDSVVVVPAGSSKSVKVNARSSDNGEYNFKVLALDANNAVVGEQSFTAQVEGRSAVGGNAAVVLTIILAIVFVVLLVVLIVLLTRKPAKTDELGESYY